ncbi:MAG: flagellar hook capping FlgD N-terminal domain-containing protein [Acidobacteriota bacterium]
MTTTATSSLLPTSATPTPQPAVTDKLGADKGTFLKLLVAQLRFQNPLEPADGTQFVTQLAQFSQLEQSAQMRDDLAAIRAALTTAAQATAKEV